MLQAFLLAQCQGRALYWALNSMPTAPANPTTAVLSCTLKSPSTRDNFQRMVLYMANMITLIRTSQPVFCVTLSSSMFVVNEMVVFSFSFSCMCVLKTVSKFHDAR